MEMLIMMLLMKITLMTMMMVQCSADYEGDDGNDSGGGQTELLLQEKLC